MRFRSHQSWFPKDEEFPGDYEDASSCSEKFGRAIVADGVSSAIFSRTWARLLTRSAVSDPPDLTSEEAIWAWLSPLQQEWRKGINFQSLPWHQKPKAMSTGAQSTLIVVAIDPFQENAESGGAYRLRASAIGDCVLFLIREGTKVLSFPLIAADEFKQPPHILSSIAKGVHYADKFQHLDDRCRVGDLLVICSDAVGLWAMEEYENGRHVDWMRYWGNDAAWHEDIRALRTTLPRDDSTSMRVDDCTLLLLEIITETTHEDEPELQPDRSDEPFILLERVVASAEPVVEVDAAEANQETGSGSESIPPLGGASGPAEVICAGSDSQPAATLVRDDLPLSIGASDTISEPSAETPSITCHPDEEAKPLPSPALASSTTLRETTNKDVPPAGDSGKPDTPAPTQTLVSRVVDGLLEPFRRRDNPSS